MPGEVKDWVRSLQRQWSFLSISSHIAFMRERKSSRSENAWLALQDGAHWIYHQTRGFEPSWCTVKPGMTTQGRCSCSAEPSDDHAECHLP